MPCTTGHFFNDKIMKTKRLFFLLIVGMFLNACNNKSNIKKEFVENENVTPEVNFAATDSVELNFYKPSKNQKEKQTFIIKDTAFINALAKNLNARPIETNECSHTIKLYLFNNGDVYKTIYVALGDSCQYLAYAVNSKSYFVPLGKELENKLHPLVTTKEVSKRIK